MIAQEEKGLVAQALKAKKSPAQVIYALAQARGFSGSSAASSPNPAPTPNPAAQKLENIKLGQQKTVLLSNVGGSPGEGMSIEALVNMSDEEFHKKVGHLSRNQLRKLLGESNLLRKDDSQFFISKTLDELREIIQPCI
jgi:hypothetical protein